VLSEGGAEVPADRRAKIAARVQCKQTSIIEAHARPRYRVNTPGQLAICRSAHASRSASNLRQIFPQSSPYVFLSKPARGLFPVQADLSGATAYVSQGSCSEARLAMNQYRDGAVSDHLEGFATEHHG
jgi:hypothetical protein